MAGKKKSGGSDVLAWLFLLLCLGIVGFVVYKTGAVPIADNNAETVLHLQDRESPQETLSTAPDTSVATEPDTSVATEPPITQSPTTEATETQTENSEVSELPTEEPLPFSKTDPLLILVNSHKTYENTPENLKSWRNQWGVYVAEEAHDALSAMIEAGEKLGLHFVVCSGYRSQELQEELFSEDVKRYENRGMSQEEAVAAASLYTMPPGHSEHGTGLAVDIVSYYNQNLDSSQEDTSETRWLQTHCWEYGFILRYPKDKSSITGIAYEPWHYRYVGKEAAKYLTEHNMTLEEFHDQ